MINMPEYLDIIDKNNRIIGKESRENCYRKKLLHRGLHIFIFNSKGQLLLQKRSKKKITCPGYWTSSVSGHVESGSSYEKAAMREMREEIGIKTELEKVCDFYSTEKYGKVIDKEIIRLFVGFHKGSFKINKEEVSEVKFFDLEKLEKMIGSNKGKFTPNLKRALERFSKALMKKDLKGKAWFLIYCLL